jgi:hypothetical protein
VYSERDWHQLQQTLAMQYEGEMLAKQKEFAAQLEEVKAHNARLTTQVTKLSAEKKAQK